MKDSDTLSDTLSMPKIIDDHLICTLFNLDPHKIQLVKCERDPAANVTVIHITLHPTYPPCPICGARRPLIKDYYIRKIKHSVLMTQEPSSVSETAAIFVLSVIIPISP